MSLGNDFEQLVEALPDDWRQASLRLRFERDMQPGGGKIPADATRELIGAEPGGIAIVTLDPGTAPAIRSAVRSLERAGFRGEVQLIDVIAAGTEALARWRPPDELLHGRVVAVPGGGYAYRVGIGT
jgi:hypothetical protein